MIRNAFLSMSALAVAVTLSACGNESSTATTADARNLNETSFCLGTDINVNSGLVQYYYRAECSQKLSNGKFRLDSQSALSTVFFPISDKKKAELKKQTTDELSKLGLKSVARISNQDVLVKNLPASSKHLCIAIKSLRGGADAVLGCTEGANLQTDPLKKESAAVILSRAGFSLIATIPSLDVSKTEQYLYSK